MSLFDLNPKKSQSIVGHLDMDAFFAAVEERDHPRLKGRPVVVGSDPRNGKGRGVVSTANYAARKYGIHSALPISKAWALAEEARKKGGEAVVFMEVNFESYGKASRKVMEIIRSFAPRIEQASIDEAYFDLSHFDSFTAAREIAQKIKQEIRKKEKLTASIGIGPNKMIAKIASDMEKPDGLTVIEAGGVEKFIAPLSIRKIPGIGPKTETELQKEKILTIQDLQKLGRQELIDRFGKLGGELYLKARGIASAEIIEEWTAKSISEEFTFDRDTLDAALIAKALKELAGGVVQRFKKSGFNSFRTMTLKVRFEGFRTVTRSHTFDSAIEDADMLNVEALRMIMPFFDSRENPGRQKLRLLGLKIDKLM